MSKATLTDISVRALKPPAQGQTTVWDAASPLGVRVSQGGSKTFIVLIGSGKRKVIGRFPVIGLAAARKEAQRILAEKTLGIRHDESTETYEVACKRYLAHCEKKNRPGTVASYRRLLGHLNFGKAKLAEITSQEIVRKLDKLADRPVEHHHAIVAGRIFFAWCVRQHYLDRSPMERIRPSKVKSERERVLSDDELAAVYKTAREGDTHFHRIVGLLVLTGQRKSEIAKLQWSWISGQDRTITLPASITKNKRTHTFPIGDAAQAIIASAPRLNDTYVFPAAREQVRGKPSTTFNGWGKPKAAFDSELKDKGFAVAHFTLHDLRRTLSSGLAALGVPQTVVEKLVNHVSGGSQSPIAKIYNRYAYLPEMRDAVARWEQHLERLLARA
jgi:integrase